MMQVNVQLPVQRVLKNHGLGTSNAVRLALAKAVRRRCDKYVPYDTGALRASAEIARDGRSITYTMPYASRQFYENYHHDDPNRGDHWPRRMLRRERQALLRELEKRVKGGFQ